MLTSLAVEVADVGTPVPPRKRPPEGLTSIHPRIHWPATNPKDTDHSETDLIMIENFLSTLAEVAIAVASRKAGQDRE